MNDFLQRFAIAQPQKLEPTQGKQSSENLDPYRLSLVEDQSKVLIDFLKTRGTELEEQLLKKGRAKCEFPPKLYRSDDLHLVAHKVESYLAERWRCPYFQVDIYANFDHSRLGMNHPLEFTMYVQLKRQMESDRICIKCVRSEVGLD